MKRSADAQEQRHEHCRVKEDKTAVRKLPEGQVEHNQDDYADRRGAGDAVDLFQPGAVAAVAVDERELKRAEEEKDQRQAKRQIGDQLGLVRRVDGEEPLQTITQPVGQHEGDDGQEQIADAQGCRPPARRDPVIEVNQPVPVRNACCLSIHPARARGHLGSAMALALLRLYGRHRRAFSDHWSIRELLIRRGAVRTRIHRSSLPRPVARRSGLPGRCRGSVVRRPGPAR